MSLYDILDKKMDCSDGNNNVGELLIHGIMTAISKKYCPRDLVIHINNRMKESIRIVANIIIDEGSEYIDKTINQLIEKKDKKSLFSRINSDTLLVKDVIYPGEFLHNSNLIIEIRLRGVHDSFDNEYRSILTKNIRRRIKYNMFMRILIFVIHHRFLNTKLNDITEHEQMYNILYNNIDCKEMQIMRCAIIKAKPYMYFIPRKVINKCIKSVLNKISDKYMSANYILDDDIEPIDNEDICPICLGLQLRPRVLTCGHSICNDCTYELIDNCTDTCPTCREKITAPYPINISYSRVIMTKYPQRTKQIIKK